MAPPMPARRGSDDRYRHGPPAPPAIAFLDGVGARIPSAEAVADFPDEAINASPLKVEDTPWHLLEHIRLTQADILDYIVNRDYAEKEWPTSSGRIAKRPPRRTSSPPRSRASAPTWPPSGRSSADPATDLFATIPNTPGHTILREIRIVGEHDAYHVGEFAVLRQVMGTWPEGREG